MIQEKSCGAVVYRVENKQRLYLIEHMKLGHISICKGHVENNETEVETAMREIKEETNIDVEVDTRFRETTIYSPYEGILKEVVYFVAKALSNTLINQECEVSGLEWVPIDQAIEAMTYKDDKLVLAKADAYLTQLENKIRTIITQDAEVDDQNSLRHFLFYSNEVDLQGIIQTSSKFHHKGNDTIEPHRWTGTKWMNEVIDDYEKDYPNLLKYSPFYPTPDYLRSITKIGNIEDVSEMEKETEGSRLIKKHILDDDPRKLYIQVWGGTNTIAKALKDLEEEYKDNWEQMYQKIVSKVVLTACGEQDDTYRNYIAESYPDLPFIKTFQLRSYAYAWFITPEGESKDCLRAKFMKEEILNKPSYLIQKYCTWLDGNYYEGEEENSQFGADPDIVDKWFGVEFFNHPHIEKYDFLSEGDSPTYFALFNWGLRTLEDFGYGGFSGRYIKADNEFNSKGQPLNYYLPCTDEYLSKDGKAYQEESMFRYVEDIQKDFASRIDWASYGKGEKQPFLRVVEGCDLTAKAGERLSIHTLSNDSITYRIYQEASSVQRAELVVEDTTASIMIPEDAQTGDTLHIIVQAKKNQLTHYQQIIITVK